MVRRGQITVGLCRKESAKTAVAIQNRHGRRQTPVIGRCQRRQAEAGAFFFRRISAMKWPCLGRRDSTMCQCLTAFQSRPYRARSVATSLGASHQHHFGHTNEKSRSIGRDSEQEIAQSLISGSSRSHKIGRPSGADVTSGDENYFTLSALTSFG
jgi:hypothetical protein